ncbi:MAG: nucleoside phosphorylase [Chitinophagales bacterium]|jgi:uridine phosphorylase|nr:nucleoside phosphorylase [Chitinophagales bacterium]
MNHSELILNERGAIYHLDLRPEEISDKIILVGDQNRVSTVSAYFDSISFQRSYREFVTHRGIFEGKDITVISTGIGTDNIDIVLNELDALVNIDFETRQVKKTLSTLRIIRIGTSGTIRPEIPIDSLLCSSYAIGLDNLMQFYSQTLNQEEAFLYSEFQRQLTQAEISLPFYIAAASQSLLKKFDAFKQGITVTNSGFYAPQLRHLRFAPKYIDLWDLYARFICQDRWITNFEMETAGIYGLSRLMGHEALSVSAIIANRASGDFSNNIHAVIQKGIEAVLERI